MSFADLISSGRRNLNRARKSPECSPTDRNKDLSSRDVFWGCVSVGIAIWGLLTNEQNTGICI